MNNLLLKLVVTPILIGAASLAGRRWGHSISGWLVALPLTTGPITFFLALTHGPTFASIAAAGTVAGGISQAIFAYTYGKLSSHWWWLPTLLAACLAFGLVTAVMGQITLPLIPLYCAVLLSFVVAFQLLPRISEDGPAPDDLPSRWDIPFRMTIATVFVILLTGIASNLGPHLTGLIAPFPIFTATLAAFAHRQHGAEAAVKVLRGLLLGLFSFASFFFALAVLLPRAGIFLSFLVAILVVFILQGFSLWLLQRKLGS